MTNYALPVNDKDISKAKTFYDLICWGGLLIVLLPVGIANVILGYFMGDSPCTLCWGQRQEMAYIGVVALFRRCERAALRIVTPEILSAFLIIPHGSLSSTQ